jgi:hypothetical protein
MPSQSEADAWNATVCAAMTIGNGAAIAPDASITHASAASTNTVRKYRECGRGR